MKLHKSITDAPMSRELYGLAMRRLYEHVPAEPLPDDMQELLNSILDSDRELLGRLKD